MREGGAESLGDTDDEVRYVNGASVNEVKAMSSVDYIYLLTLAHGDGYELVGVFLDPLDAQMAKKSLIKRGVNPDILDIDHAPIGVVDLRGIDKPYLQGPIH